MIDVVCGVIRNEKGEYLITQRGDSNNYGKWEFPGGKVQVGESLFQSLKREILEELKINIEPIYRFYVYPFKGFKLIFILCEFRSDNVVQINEHLDYKWENPGNFQSYDFLEGDKLFISDFLKVLKISEDIGFDYFEDMLFLQDLFKIDFSQERFRELLDFRTPEDKRKDFSSIRDKILKQLIESEGDKCQLKYECCDLTSGYNVDHFIPLSSNILNKSLRKIKPEKGKKVKTQSFGSNHPNNLIVSCKNCNSFKKHRFPEQKEVENFLSLRFF